MPLDAKAVLKRWNTLRAARVPYEAVWQQIAEQVLPRKADIAVGSKRTEALFDSTAPHSAELLAATLNGTLTPMALKWFTISFRDQDVNEDKEVMDWRSDTSERMWLALNQSNFASHMHECWMDIVALGTSALMVEEQPRQIPGFNGLRFRSLPLSEYAIAENASGIVDTVYRRFSLTARAAADQWGEEALPSVVKKQVEKEPDREYWFLHAVEPRPLAERKGARAEMPWASAYVEESTKTLVGKEGGFHEMPILVGRWAKASGEIYGYGPGHTALPDVRTLNKAVELTLKQWGLAVQPPTKSRVNGVIGPIRQTPGGNTLVNDMGDLEEWVTKARFDVTWMGLERLEKKIRDMFFVDQLQLKDSPQMTALEVQVRFELMNRFLGPSLGRMMTEKLNPTVERVFGLMLRAKAFRPPPQRLQEYVRRQGQWDVEYQSPLARASRSPELTAIERSYSLAAPIAQIRPDIMDNVDHDAVLRHVWEVTGAPSKLLRGEEAVAVLRKQREDAAAAEKTGADALAVTEGVKNIAPAIAALQRTAPARTQPPVLGEAA